MRTPSPNHRLSHLPKILFRALLLLLPALFLVTFIAHYLQAPKPSSQPGLFQSETTSPSDWHQPQIVENLIPAGARPIFPYSIVPGGVRDAKELQAASSSDQVVARHYSDFKIASARAVRLEHPLAMYVSYRRNGRVFWTKGRLIIPAGETLLTDGKNLARTRCANRLSPVAAKPVAATDPTTEELEQPSFVPPLMTGLLPPGDDGSFSNSPSAIPAGPLAPRSGGSITPPVLPPIYLPASPPLRPHTPVIPPPSPVSTPEPGSLALLLVGIVTLFLFTTSARRR